MPGRVVCNASPLIFLAKIDRLDLLDDYELYIPSHVETESRDLIQKGYRIKQEIFIEFLRNLEREKKID